MSLSMAPEPMKILKKIFAQKVLLFVHASIR